MRWLSSASLTCSAVRSASEYTATAPMPMRFAVRITRQAISPRFAIRILRNTLALPGGLALLEEGGDAFLALGRSADLGDAPRGVALQRIIDRPAGDLAHEVLDARVRFAAAIEQMPGDRVDGLIEFRRGRERRQEADPQRLGGVEDFSREEVTARCACT